MLGTGIALAGLWAAVGLLQFSGADGFAETLSVAGTFLTAVLVFREFWS